MTRPAARSIAIAVPGGAVHAAVVTGLILAADYPMVDSTGAIAAIAAFGFVLGVAPLSLSVHTRLLAPASGLVALVAWTTYLEVTSPSPRIVDELGGHAIYDGPTYALDYVTAWPTWLVALSVAGLVEFAIRRGYGLGDARLRHLPDLPSSRSARRRIVAGTSALVGVVTVVQVELSHAPSVVESALFFVAAAAATAVPLAALLSRGSVAPLAVLAFWLPRVLHVEAFGSSDSGVHLLLLGPLAIVCAIAWRLELWLRSRYLGWDGGRFAAE